MSEHPLDQVETNPHLPMDDNKGWVTLNDHLILIEWRPKEALTMSAAYKELCERVSAEAALMKGQTEVHIKSKIHSESTEGRRQKRHTVIYDPHITVIFPALDRRAHIYVGPSTEKNYRNMKIWRRQEKPAVVLC